MDVADVLPRWLQELKRFQALRSAFFLYGNVYDCYYYPTNYREATAARDLVFAKYTDLGKLLQQHLFSQGFELVTYFDVVDGIFIASRDQSITATNVISELQLPGGDVSSYLKNAQAKKLDDAISFHREMIRNTQRLSAGIINFASRITSNPNALEEEAKPIFLKILKAAQESVVFADKAGLRNILIFVCDKLNDIPAWVWLENPMSKSIEVQKPNRDERRQFFDKRKQLFFQYSQGADIVDIERIFPDLTENFTNSELENLITISRQEKLPISRVKEIIDLFKYGVRENPWEKIDAEKIDNAGPELEKRVLGQPAAIQKAVEIIRRSNLGLDSIDRVKPANKPKGVLFFAGPTGTGKTEMAKALAELIFSDEDAMVRFDMSEYNDRNSDVKLIGSPPGYVGYEEGGQLTDAIRKKPFSILLFDEIEKAHPKVFDKFLQILDDGRLTDGKGETVYFSQCLIIFTSNLGIYREDDSGRKVENVAYSESESYEELESKIKEEIRRFFGNNLGRPEIFNRFGDNFVVFDFIRPPVAEGIARKNLKIISENLKTTRNISLDYDDTFIRSFLDTCVVDNLGMGGRGIVNRLETHIKNGLTNFMFETKKLENCAIRLSCSNGVVRFE